jgi:hypothetical protein
VQTIKCVLRLFILPVAGRVNEQFEFRDPRNKLVGELGDDSQFEVSGVPILGARVGSDQGGWCWQAFFVLPDWLGRRLAFG